MEDITFDTTAYKKEDFDYVLSYDVTAGSIKTQRGRAIFNMVLNMLAYLHKRKTLSEKYGRLYITLREKQQTFLEVGRVSGTLSYFKHLDVNRCECGEVISIQNKRCAVCAAVERNKPKKYNKVSIGA